MVIDPVSRGYTEVKSVTRPNIVTLMAPGHPNDIYALNLWKSCE